MAFSEAQQASILLALGEKITSHCPSCSRMSSRVLIPELATFPLGQPITEPDPISKGGTPKSPEQLMFERAKLKHEAAKHPKQPVILPCVVVTCSNCGLTEFYNTRALGVTDILGLY